MVNLLHKIICSWQVSQKIKSVAGIPLLLQEDGPQNQGEDA